MLMWRRDTIFKIRIYVFYIAMEIRRRPGHGCVLDQQQFSLQLSVTQTISFRLQSHVYQAKDEREGTRPRTNETRRKIISSTIE